LLRQSRIQSVQPSSDFGTVEQSGVDRDIPLAGPSSNRKNKALVGPEATKPGNKFSSDNIRQRHVPPDKERPVMDGVGSQN
jgi:hypothetical protein